ncbi:unnamed protein product [Jaminaea pallidilutea]
MSATLTAEVKNRDERILAAKKKLKSYRAKQAQAAKRSSLSKLTPAQMKRASASFAQAIEDTVVEAAEQSQQTSHLQTSQPGPSVDANVVQSHSRRPSRAGHGRGHSRTASISVSADTMASKAFNAAASSVQTPSSPASTSRPVSHRASVVHGRRHSRSHSRSPSISISSRPLSFRAAKSTDHPVLAIERDATSGGDQNHAENWRDDEGALEPSDSPLKHFQMTSGPSSSVSPSHFQPEPRVAAASASHARRPSRHSRQASLATKRESMELMGGLGFPSSQSYNALHPEPKRESRRLSSNRFSGLQSASVLFGGDSRRSGLHDFDWRGKFGQGLDDEEDRQTALDKLEGRGNHQAEQSRPAVQTDLSNRASFRHSRQSSVQLPSFDEIHGNEGMDRRSSLQLLETNQRTTSDENPKTLGDASSAWLSPGNTLTSSQSLPDILGSKSPKPRPSSMFISNDTQSAEGLTTLIEEEEEEDVSSPAQERPSLNLLNSGSSAVEDESALQRRKEGEREIARRTRRSSLQPKPLKLKSRPASLFVTSTMQRAMRAYKESESSAAPTEQHSNDSWVSTADHNGLPDAADAADSSDSAGELSQDWSMSASQQRAQSRLSTENVASEEQPAEASFSATSSSTPSRPAMRALRLGSMSSLSSSKSDSALPTPSAMNTTSSNAKPNLRLENLPSPGAMMSSSTSSPTLRRSSIMYKTTPSEAQGSATAQAAASNAISQTALEELRVKTQRDSAQLEHYRSQVDLLTMQLNEAAERAAAEYSQLEQQAAADKQTLSAQINDLEEAVELRRSEATQREEEAASTIEGSRKTIEELQEQLEDAQAERDMLAEDVQGWRTRCSGLEKSLRDERANGEAERQLTATLRLKIATLSEKLRVQGIEVPATAADEDKPSVGPSLPSVDLLAALASPALDPNSSHSAGGYFAAGASPNNAPPQAVKLLKDMRQQIFNLAGSLEHERKEHLRAQKEADHLRELNQQLLSDRSYSATDAQQSPKTDPSTAGSRLSQNSNHHVFAYDSSTGSVDNSNTSLGSQVTDMTSIAESDQSSGKVLKNDNVAALPDSQVLQTLPEENDDAQSATVDDGSATVERPSSVSGSVDLEVGDACSETSSPDEGNIRADDRLSTYRTPALEPNATFSGTPPAIHPSEAGTEDLSDRTPTGSSSRVAVLEKSRTPSNERSSGEASSGFTLETSGPASPSPTDEWRDEEDASDEEKSTASDHGDDRPEFIREWSYQHALFAAQRKGGVSASSKRSRHRKPSIDDFFGLSLCEQLEPLPPLASSHASLEMPPVFIEYNEGPVIGGTGRNHSAPSHHASIVGVRPPVSKSAYIRSDSASSLGSALTRSGSASSFGSSQSAGPRGSNGSAYDASRSGSLALATAGRMSLQGLTSAFSGLGGYLAGQSGAAVTAAASATAMCAKADEMGYESRQPSMSEAWIGQQDLPSSESGALKSIGTVNGAKRFSAARTVTKRAPPPSPPMSRSRLVRESSSSYQAPSGVKSQPMRRKLLRWEIEPPSGSPIWLLDFSQCTEGPAVFSV